jgi:hypothetical protein
LVDRELLFLFFRAFDAPSDERKQYFKVKRTTIKTTFSLCKMANNFLSFKKVLVLHIEI